MFYLRQKNSLIVSFFRSLIFIEGKRIVPNKQRKGVSFPHSAICSPLVLFFCFRRKKERMPDVHQMKPLYNNTLLDAESCAEINAICRRNKFGLITQEARLQNTHHPNSVGLINSCILCYLLQAPNRQKRKLYVMKLWLQNLPLFYPQPMNSVFDLTIVT